MLFRTDDFKKMINNFPSHDVSESVKLSKEYQVAWAECIYSRYLRGQCLTTLDLASKIRENRKLMRGDQDVTPYMGYFFGEIGVEMTEQFIRDALMNIDWTPVAAAIKFCNVPINMFDEAVIDR